MSDEQLKDQEDPFNISGPDAVMFIHLHQINPALLEELSAIIMKIDKEHTAKLGVDTTNLVYLRSGFLRSKDDGFETQRKGYSLYVTFYKADDRKDPSGWKQIVFFLSTNEEGKIHEIIELAERDAQEVDNLYFLNDIQEVSSISEAKLSTFSQPPI